METVKPYVAPAYPVQPMPMKPMPMQNMPMPMPVQNMPMPMHLQSMPMNVNLPVPKPMMPMAEKPAHHDIHLHASYQQTSIVIPPKVTVAAPLHRPSNAGAILVLFILLVIISRSYRMHHKC